MIDIVFPDNNEQKFIEIAERLRISQLCFAYDKPTSIAEFQAMTGIRLFNAVMCGPENVKKFKGSNITIVKAPEDQTRLRFIIEKVRPDILFNLEFSRQTDFIHHRASGLNHVLAALAKQKKVAVGFNFSAILNAKPRQRAVYMGRIMQNIRFARKFRFRTVKASFAGSPWQLRSEHDLKSFFITLGMTAGEVNAALEWRGDR